MRKSLLWFLFSLQGFLVVVQAKSFVHAMFNFTKRKCSASTGTIDKLHILRVPKASSSVLSVVARRAVGCVPAGPCCKFPGDPPGSCPSEELFTCQKERRVLGCTNHYSNYPALLNPNMTSISIMREPIARSISAYFYPGTHHNSNCTQNQDQCFLQYLQNPQWQNVVVKMLTGQHAYSTLPTCRYKSQCSHSLELARENLDHVLVFGVADMWELSLMLIHCKLRHINPIFEEFKLGLRTGNTTGEFVLSCASSQASVSIKLSSITSMAQAKGLTQKSSTLHLPIALL